jgi:hypothetical protein
MRTGVGGGPREAGKTSENERREPPIQHLEPDGQRHMRSPKSSSDYRERSL